MSRDTHKSLESWWVGLSEAQRARLLPLEEGDEMPPGHVIGLANALGAGPAGAKWEHDGYTMHVDPRVSTFLEQKRIAG